MKESYFKEGEKIVQNAPQLYIDFDVEADGKPGYGSLLSIGAVTPFGDEFYRELKPSSDNWVESQRQFCEEHNLQRDRLIEEGVSPKEAVVDFIDWANKAKEEREKSGIVLSAFNASFDYPWVDLEIAKAGIKSPFGVAGFCTKSLALAIYPDYDWKQTGKERLPKEIIPEGDFTHNALEDAIYQQKLHFALVGLINAIRR